MVEELYVTSFTASCQPGVRLPSSYDQQTMPAACGRLLGARNVTRICPAGCSHRTYKGALKTYNTQPTIKERGEEAHMRSAVQGLPQWWRHDSRRCACMWARPLPSALSHHPLAGKWFVFARAKKNEKAAWRETMASPGSPLSPLFPLFFFLSFSLSPSLSISLSLPPPLSLRFSLSLSLSQPLSLSRDTHTEKLSSQCSSLRWAHWLCIQLHPPGWVRFVEHSNCRKHA